MSQQINKAVESFKKENGNKDYTQKELIMYLVKRVDDLPCMEHVTKIQENYTRGKFLLWLNGVEVSVILTLLVLIINNLLG